MKRGNEVNDDGLKQMVCRDHRLTVRMVVNHLDMKKKAIVQKITTADLGKGEVCAKIALRLLNEDKMWQDIIQCL